MLTLRDAAALLAAADSLPALAALGRALGFTTPPLPIAPALAATLGADGGDTELAVVPGPGLLRLLLVRAGAAPAATTIERCARRLARTAPHPLWCMIACDGREVAIATWTGDRAPPRVLALRATRDSLVDSDAETVRLLAASFTGDDAVTHAGWTEVLGRDALTRRFYVELEAAVRTMADGLDPHGTRLGPDGRRELALLNASRLLFLSFVQAKGWLDSDATYLTHRFMRCRDAGGGYHQQVLLPLFFGTLNTPPARRAAAARALGRVPFLNGGLFARTALERRARSARFPDESLSPLFDRVLSRYRFTAREDRLTWSETAVDPEMLGHAFETLMEPAARRRTGAFYTPPALVAHVTRLGLAQALAGDGVAGALVERLLAGSGHAGGAGAPASETDLQQLRGRTRRLRVLDPACGSGAFLVHALESLSTLLVNAGDARSPSVIRRELLASCIFGVDVNPMAVWLAELRLWLSAVIDCTERDPLRVSPLPNLDRNVRVGDALAGGGLGVSAPGVVTGVTPPQRASDVVALLRRRYARATGAAKHALGRRLEREERAAALRAVDARLDSVATRRRDLVAFARGPDLFGARRGLERDEVRRLELLRREARSLGARRRAIVAGAGLPFAFATHFPDLSDGVALVIGNPPWVRPHNVPERDRLRLRREFVSVRDAAWRGGAAAAGAGFAGQADVAAPFVERSLSLLQPGGTMALVLPSKLWRALAGGGLRALLADRGTVVRVEDWTGSRHAFDAAVYPSVLVARAPRDGEPAASSEIAVVEHARDRACSWRVDARRLPLERDPASPWILVPPDVRAAFDRVASSGIPLAHSGLGRPLLGVKCGCNEAFLVRPDDPERRLLAPLLRPLLRGSALVAWRPPPDGDEILWLHDDLGEPLAELPPAAARRLQPWRRRLAARADARGSVAWWSVFRTAAALSDRPRVVWADIGTAPRAVVLPAGHPAVPLNSCYAVRCAADDDALALAALLNSPVARAWLGVLAEPARGGYRRHMAWTVSLLPLPRPWEAARATLAALACQAWGGLPPSDDELTHAVCDALGIRASEIGALLEWDAR